MDRAEWLYVRGLKRPKTAAGNVCQMVDFILKVSKQQMDENKQMIDNLREYFVGLMKEVEPPSDFLKLLNSLDKKKPIFNFKRPIANPLELANAVLLTPNVTHPLISHDYLNDQDKANDDIMCNIAAMNDTASKMVFVASQNRGVLGYWLGCSKTSTPPYLYLLDTEGQYRICEGESLADTLCNQYILNGDTKVVDLLSASFKKIEVKIEHKSEEQIYSSMDVRIKETATSPQFFRHERYNHYRNERGMPPIKYSRF